MSERQQGLGDAAGPFRFGVFEFDPRSLELTRSGYAVRLQELPAKLLNALLRQAGELVTREQLQGELWASDTFVQFDAGLNTAMNKLRQALRDSADRPQFIETVPRTGYRFIAPVVLGKRAEVIAQETTQPVSAPEPPSPVTTSPVTTDVLKPSRPRLWFLLGMGAALIGLAVVAFLWKRITLSGTGPTTRFAIDLPPGQQFNFYSGRHIAISPNGSTVAWIAETRGIRQIYVRNLTETAYHPLAETRYASGLCFSPNGDWLAFQNFNGELRKVSVDGRWNTKLLDLGPRSADGTLVWANDGWIYFSAVHFPPDPPTETRAMYRVRAEGGAPEPVLKGPQPVGAWYPRQVLPQGLLFAIDYAPSDIAVSLLASADQKVRQLIRHASGGTVLPTGHLIYAQSGNLMAVPFDIDRMETIGKPSTMVAGVAPDRYAGLQMDVSQTGTLVYLRSSLVHHRRLVWVDKSGHETPTKLPVGRYRLLDLSADNAKVLLTRFDSGDHWSIGSYELETGDFKEILSGDSPGTGAIFSPDAKSVVVAARYQGERMDTLYLKPLNMDGGEQPLLSDAYSGKYPQSWSAASKAVAYMEGYYQATKRDVYALSLSPGAKPQLIARTPEDDYNPSFSPDGHWISYSSKVSGRAEVYVQRYPGPVAPVRVSESGGSNSLWGPGGKELYYRDQESMLQVSFDPATGKAGSAHRLFSGNYDLGGTPWNRDVAISRDGSRFLMLKVEQDPPDYRQIQVVLNWFRELPPVTR